MPRILITDVTQMGGNRVCVAGLTQDLENIRPDIGFPGITEDHLYQNGKAIIRPGAVVTMELSPKPNCKPPHVEDHHWENPELTEQEKRLDDTKWREVLGKIVANSVKEGFDTDILDNKYLRPNTGKGSLITLQPEQPVTFLYQKNRWEDGEYLYRLSFQDKSGMRFTDIPITDLSLQRCADFLRIKHRMSTVKITDLLNQHFQNARQLFLRIGVTRPCRYTSKKMEKSELRCYLQVNGIYTFPDYLKGRCFADFKLTGEKEKSASSGT